jgi:hypothetical protein
MSRSGCGALLECQQLLRAEALVVDLGCGLDQVLEMGTSEEVAQVDELAVALVLYVDGTPAILAGGNAAAADGDGVFASDNCEGDDGLSHINVSQRICR